MLFLYLSGVEAPSRNVALSVLAMSAGTVISSFGEAHFNLTGFLIMCAAETSEATRLVLTQRLLCNLKFGAFEGLYLMAPICAAWMWGLALFLEVPKLRASGDFAKIVENGDVFFIAALLGFAVNVASFLVIKRTSSVMLCGNQIFNPTSMCAYATVSTRCFLPCFQNSTRAIDSSKNQPNRLQFD